VITAKGEISNMESLSWRCLYAIVISSLFIVQLTAQEHARYKLVDLGTFGGPGGGIANPSYPALNKRGMLVGASDTAISCPYNPGRLITHGFEWNDGVLTDLGTLQGGCFSGGSGINERGLIVGQSENGLIDPSTGSPEADAVLWRNGHIVNLGTLGGSQSNANAVNDRGQVVGGALNRIPCVSGFCSTFSSTFLFYPGTTETHAFRWTEAEGMQDLGTLGGPDSNAGMINRHGQIVGESFTSFIPNPSSGAPPLDPFLWENGTMTDLGGLGGTSGAPTWLNNRGQVVGGSNLSGDATMEPFLWSKTAGMRNLGSLGGNFGFANWINDAGEVVGQSTTPQALRGFLWKDGVMTNLGTVGTDPSSEAYSINSQGQVVGASYSLGFVELHGFLWENGGPIADLNTLLLRVSDLIVTAGVIINDRGEIGCLGHVPSDVSNHACLLIPCDEKHADVEGCEDAPEATKAATQDSLAPTTQTSGTMSQARLTPEMLAAVRARFARRSRGFRISGRR
jgi:probable HAF family extracellular repeat protein